MCVIRQNQVRSEERAEDAAAVVFHLLVTSSPPRSRPSTPPAAADSAAAVNGVRISADAPPSEAAGEAVDSPRPMAAAPPALSVDGASAPAQQQPAASFAFPAFGHFPGQQAAPPAAAATPSAPPQQDMFAQGMLMHQQAMILAQIQYLQYLKTHSQQQQSNQAAAGNPTHPPAQAPHHPYAHFGYFGMGMHHPQMLNPMHGLQQPGVHPVGQHPAAVGARFHNLHPATTPAAPAAAEPAAPRPVPLAVQIAREILPLFDIRLAMKMAFMLFIIGQDTPNDRVLMLAFLSFISYLYVRPRIISVCCGAHDRDHHVLTLLAYRLCRHITGILAKIYEVYKRHYTPSTDANGAENAAEEANNQNGANNAAGGRVNGVAAGIARMDFARVLRISSDRGIIQDIKYFFVGFLLSLVPAWHPQPLQGAAGATAAPPVQDMPDVAEMPVQGI